MTEHEKLARRVDRLAAVVAESLGFAEAFAPKTALCSRSRLGELKCRAVECAADVDSPAPPLTECEVAFNMFYRDTPGKRPIRGARWEAFEGGWEARDPK